MIFIPNKVPLAAARTAVIVSDPGQHKLQLFLAHRPALVSYATPIVGCRAQAEDIVQEAWLRFAGAEPSSQPSAYLYRIVRNLALDFIRRPVREEQQAAEDDFFDFLSDQRPSPEQIALQREELLRVHSALAELPERTRRVFELYRLEGLTLQAIADQLQLSVAMVHNLVRQALTHCARSLADDGN